jgi:hypothetical protein
MGKQETNSNRKSDLVATQKGGKRKMKESYKLTRGITKVDVPHRGSTITFVWPIIGPKPFVPFREESEREEGLVMPTLGQVVSLALIAKENSGEPEFRDLVSYLNSDSLIGNTAINYVPN